MKKLIILFASVLLVAAVIAVAVVATETETNAETNGEILSETEANEDATDEAVETEIVEDVYEIDGWNLDVYDADNLVDPELLNMLYLGMTEKDMMKLIGYPIDDVGYGHIGVVYNISDGRTCYIYTTHGAEWTDRTIETIQINGTDGSINKLHLTNDGVAHHMVYGVVEDGKREILLNEVIEDVTVASNLIEADTVVIAKTSTESDNTEEASE